MMKLKSQTWRQSAAYEICLLAGIAICVWISGEWLGLFDAFEQLMIRAGLTKVVYFGFLMGFALATLSVLKSIRLRRAIEVGLQAAKQARILARHDVLTGLPNRRLFSELVAKAFAHAPDTTGHAVFLIDLDRFKAVNDLHGHAAGDAVLCETAARLVAMLEPRAGTAARLGGDEFAALVPYDLDNDGLAALAQEMVDSLSAPIAWQEVEVEVGATIGIAPAPQEGLDAEELLRHADMAMYRGKREGRSTFRVFEPAMEEELQARISLEAGLRAAITRGEIKPHYQALVKLPGEELVGFEVLARWYHPEKGILAPDTFIHIAEDAGLITELSFGLLRQACEDAKRWPEHLSLAINVSPVQLKDRLLAPRLLGILSEARFPPNRLEIEVTESALTSDIEVARETLRMLQSFGVGIALDDFGTGYSSLCNLREINFDKIKIDRSFVQTLGESEESSKIVSAILGLGKSLGIKTTAEGIETPHNSDWLTEQGCTTGQGFLFGRPMPASAVDQLFEAMPAELDLHRGAIRA
jgi:diguanylate cyclase (GGDEF)-like protein